MASVFSELCLPSPSLSSVNLLNSSIILGSRLFESQGHENERQRTSPREAKDNNRYIVSHNSNIKDRENDSLTKSITYTYTFTVHRKKGGI